MLMWGLFFEALITLIFIAANSNPTEPQHVKTKSIPSLAILLLGIFLGISLIFVFSFK